MPTDTCFIRILHWYGQVLGITSSWMKRDNTKNYLLKKIYIIILLILSVLGTILSIADRYYGFWKDQGTKTQVILESFGCLAEMSFYVSCFLISLTRSNYWRDLYNKMYQVEQLLNREKLYVHVKTVWFIAQMVFLHVVFVGVHGFDMFIWSKRDEDSTEFGYILERILLYYQLYLTMFVYNFAKWLDNRYTFLNQLLIQDLENKQKIVTISTENNKQFVKKLYMIKSMYASLKLLVCYFNFLLGWPIFFHMVCSILICLVSINLSFEFQNEFHDNFGLGIHSVSAMYTFVYAVIHIS